MGTCFANCVKRVSSASPTSTPWRAHVSQSMPSHLPPSGAIIANLHCHSIFKFKFKFFSIFLNSSITTLAQSSQFPWFFYDGNCLIFVILIFNKFLCVTRRFTIFHNQRNRLNRLPSAPISSNNCRHSGHSIKVHRCNLGPEKESAVRWCFRNCKRW